LAHKRNFDDIRELKKDHKSLGEDFREDLDKFQDRVGKALHEMNSSLHRIEGRIWTKKQEDSEE